MENPIMTLTMADGGKIVCELYPDKAPQSVRNMISLANKGFYDGLIFHRVISGFMIQGGCPKGTGTGGPGYCIKGEFKLNGVKNNLSHKRGVLSMARAQAANSAGSQFFIMHEDGEFLDGQYAAFGKVLEGMDVVDKIAAVKTDGNDRPLTVITGASAGLGAEFTRQLVREFPEIEEFWLIARRVGKLEELAQQFPDRKFVCIGLNLLDPKSFRYLGEKLAEQKADVRVLVNNAGCGTTGNIGSSASPADVMRVVDLNVRALTMVTQTVVPFMTRGAKIINVSSIAAFCPTPRMTVYSASKAYVSAFTGGIADELRPKGISVTAVCPGPMKTEFFDAAGDHDLFGNIPWCDPVKVVAGTIRAAKKGRTFYTPTTFNKFYRFVAKLLPMKWMIKATRV